MPTCRALALALAVLALTAPAAGAFPDDFDLTFGTGGRAFVQQGSGGLIGLGGVLDGDKVVMVGRLDDAGLVKGYIARLTAAGALDSAFAGDGVQTSGFPNAFTYAADVARTSIGWFTVVGSDSNKAFVSSIKDDGSEELNFGGGDGHMEFIPAPPAEAAATEADATAVALTASSDPVIAGTVVQNGRRRGFIALHDGVGAITAARFFDLAASGDTNVSDIVRSGSSYFVAGSVPGTTIGVAKFDTALAPDTSFGGGDGVATLAQHTAGAGVAVEADGDVVLAGGTTSAMLLARFTPAGAPDTTWDADGLRTFEIHDAITPDFPPPFEQRGLALDASGNYLVSGNVGVFSAGAAVARVKPDGTLDGTFAPGGAVQVLGAGYPNLVAADSAGRIVLAGSGSEAGKNAAFAYRLLGGAGPSRLARSPHAAPAQVPAGTPVTCDPGDFSTTATFFYRWTVGANHVIVEGQSGTFPTRANDVGKTIGCEVIANYGGRRSGIVPGDNAVTVVAPPPAVPTPVPTAVPTAVPIRDTAAGAFKRLRAGRKGTAIVELELKGPAAVAIAGKAGKVKAYSAKRTVTKAGNLKITLKPSKALTKALRRKKKLKVKVTLTLTAAARKTTASKTVTAKR